MLRQAGKTLSGWTTKIGETTVGGQPPTFDDIDTDVDKLKKFTDVIFEDDTHGRWHPKVRELLVMTLLLRYDQFVDILQSHPFSRLVEDCDGNDHHTCSSVRDNLFICRVNRALLKVGGVPNSQDSLDSFTHEFSSWVREARRAFAARNAPGLPIEVLRSYDASFGKRFLMDTRCLVDHFNALASVAQASHMELQHQRHMLNDIRQAFNVESKITSRFIVDRISNIERSVRRLEDHFIGEAPKPAASPPSKGIIRFSISSKSLPRSASLSEATIAFFADDYRAGYTLDLNSPSWDELDKEGKKKLRNKFGTIKRAVRMVLQHADSYPLLPEDQLQQYKEVVRGIATTAENRIHQALGFEDKPLSIYKLEKELARPAVKEWEKTLKLPGNTPEDVRKFFKTD